MQSLDAFLSRLMPKATGCPDPLARQALVDSAIEFCEETLIVQYTSEPQDVTAGVGEYEVDLPSQQTVAMTMKAWYGTKELNPAPADMVDKVLAYVTSAGGVSQPQMEPTDFYDMTATTVGIYPVPQVGATAMFTARIATKPVRSATALADVLYDDWVEGVVSGALARLCAIPNQAFTDLATSQTERALFWNAVTRAKNIRLRGRVKTSVSTRMRPLA